MNKKNCLTKEEKEKLLLAHNILLKFSEHDLPVVRFNCRKAKNELWQALFELDLLDEAERTGSLGLFMDG